MSDTIQRVRKKFPQYDKISDEELTWRWGKKYPQYLEVDEEFSEQFTNLDRKVRKVQLQHEMREVRKQGLKQDLAFDLQYGEPTEEGNWIDQITLGTLGGLASIGEAGHKILESGSRAVGWESGAEFFKGAAEIAGETAKEMDIVARATKGAPFAKSLGQGVSSLAPTLAAAPTGPWGMAIAAGAQSYGSSLADAERSYKSYGLSDEEAFKRAQVPALFQGLGTALITRGMMRYGGGVEEALMMSAAGRATFKELAKGIWKHGGLEMTEETSNQIYDSVVRKLSYQPELTFVEAIEQIGEAGELGAILGASMHGVRTIDGNKQAKMLDKARDKYSKQLADQKALLQTVPEGFAGEPETQLDVPTWKEVGEGLLKDVPVPEKLAKGETYTVFIKDEQGQEGAVQFSDEATRLTIERGVAASGATEITRIKRFTPPTSAQAAAEEMGGVEVAQAAQPETAPSPVVETDTEPAPAPEPAPATTPPEAQEEVEDDYEVTPEEAAMEAEAYGDEVAQEVEPEPVAETVMDRSDFLLLPKERHEEEVDILFSLLDKAEQIVAKEFEELKNLAETHPDQLSEMDRTLIERGENPNNYQENDHVVYRMAENGNKMPYYHAQLYTGQIKEEKVAVAHKFLDLLAQEQPKYQRLIAEDELNKFNAKQNRLTKDLLGKLETEDDPADDAILPRQIAKFPPRAKPKKPTIADVPDTERNFADRDIRQFSGIDRTLAEISRGLRTKKSTFAGQKPYKGLTKLQGLELKEFNDAIDAYGFLLNKDATTSEQLQEASAKIIRKYTSAVQGHLEEFGLPKLDERELRGIAFPRQTTEQTDERIEDDGSPVVEQQAGTSEGDGTGATEAPLGEQQTDGTPRPDGDKGRRTVSDATRERVRETGVEGDRASGDSESRSAEGEGRDRGTTGESVEPDRGLAGETEQLTNYVIPEGENVAPGGVKTKAKNNLAAIKLLKTLESEDRAATEEEKQILARYTGWGAMPAAFDRGKATIQDASWEKQWRSIYDEIRDTLTDEEYSAARSSLLNAHYTSQGVIRSMWDGVKKLGFNGGRVLEPSAGVGHFFGMMPADVAKSSRLWGVELDSITARILGKLYPKAEIFEGGFQDAPIENNTFDLVIGNVPFHQHGVRDNRYSMEDGGPNTFSLHNYFLARSIDVLKPGGLMVAITSDSSMDNKISRAARDWIAERADLVGAVRLPNTAFKDNAGTEVTTDILVFRKKSAKQFKESQPFVNLEGSRTYKNEDVQINQYFAQNPEMMLGRMSIEGTMYDEKGKQNALLPFEGDPEIVPLIKEAFGKMPGNVYGSKSVVNDMVENTQAPTFSNEPVEVVARVGTLVQKPSDKKVYIQTETGLEEVKGLGDARSKRVPEYIKVKHAIQDMVRSELNPDMTTDELNKKRKHLNAVYDAYVKKHGYVNTPKSSFIADLDVDFQYVAALENVKVEFVPETKDGVTKAKKVVTHEKMPIFNKRTNFPRKAPTTAQTPEDALQISLSYQNHVDDNYIGELLNVTPEGARAKLLEEKLVFENPKTGMLETPSEYLSGNVKDKLKEAEQAVSTNPAMERNVIALQEVQPEPINPEDIGFRLGTSWINPRIISDFARQKLGVGSQITFNRETQKWQIKVHTGNSEANQVLYGYPEANLTAMKLLNSALHLKDPEIYDKLPDGTSVKNKDKTLEAARKIDVLQQEFRDWVLTNPEARQEIYQTYNSLFNKTKLREYEEPEWDHYPGASPDIKLRPHQKRAVSRILQNSTLLAHSVGTGKTFIMATAAMEMKRLGLAQKPMIVVLNSTLEQFAREFRELYPAANIMVPTSKQRKEVNRKRTMSQIATGDWDAVIVPQSYIDRMPNDVKREQRYLEQELDNLEVARIKAAQELNDPNNRTPKVKDIVNAQNKLEERIEKIKESKIQDKGMTFEETGVDALFVDEAHWYKRLFFSTKMNNVKGLDTGAATRGMNMLMKTQWVQENNDGKNVVMATGTPISNTIAEIWHFMRYINPKMLREFGIESFDGFASNFAKTITDMELTAGGDFKLVKRLARYTNGPELISAFRSMSDVITQEEVPGLELPPLKNGEPTNIVIPITDQVEDAIGQIRLDLLKWEKMSRDEKKENPIPLTSHGKALKAAIDIRLLVQGAPDEPDSKLNTAVNKIFEIYESEKELKGTQLVFMDLFQTHFEGVGDDQQFNAYEDIKAKLVAAGVPDNEIVIFGPKMTEAQRQAAAEGIRSGDVRIALGSTTKLGTGLNLQERVAAVHHLDAPARPMDIEQRNGRVMRQGNLYAQKDQFGNYMYGGVEIITYGMEKTLDAATYQKLAIKQKFINQALRGDLKGRDFDDVVNEQSLSFEEQQAAFSGDPTVMQRVHLDHEMKSLEVSKRTFDRGKQDASNRLQEVTEEKIPNLEYKLEQAKEVADQMPKDGKVTEVQIEGNVINDRKQMITQLGAMISRAIVESHSIARKTGGSLNFTHQSSGPTIFIDGQEVRTTVKGIWIASTNDWDLDNQPVLEWQFVNPPLDAISGRGASGKGLLASLDNKIKEIQLLPKLVEDSLNRLIKDKTDLEDSLQKEWPLQSKYDNAKQELKALDEKILEEAKQKEEVATATENADKALTEEGQQRGMRINPRPGGGQGGFIRLDVIRDLGIKGRDLFKKGFDTFAVWVKAMKTVFGDRVSKYLDTVWNRIKRDEYADENHLSPDGVAAKHRIEGREKVDEDKKPNYPTPLKTRVFDVVSRESSRIVYYGSAALLKEKQGIEMMGQYQAAAIKKQAERLEKKLWESRRDDSAWSLPDFLRRGAWASRIKEFKGKALPLAAHLNVTGTDEDGKFIFTDFEMRAGLMSKKQFEDGEHEVGDVIFVKNPLSGEQDQLVIADPIETSDNRRGYQLLREMPADLQEEMYNHYTQIEYPEFAWFIDTFIDPKLKNVRQRVAGVEVPVFNRFSLAAMLAEGTGEFNPLDGYTPDVVVTRSLWGAVRQALRLRSGVRSAGRRYKTGKSREEGKVLDLLSGFNLRALQAAQEKTRKRWLTAVLREGRTFKGSTPPEGYVDLETGLTSIWKAIKAVRGWKMPVDPKTGERVFPETEDRLQEQKDIEAFENFKREAFRLGGGRITAIPKPLLDALIKQYAAQQPHGALYNLGAWLLRQSKGLFLVDPVTVVGNLGANEFFAAEAEFRYGVAGMIKMMSGDVQGGAQNLRFARNLFAGQLINRFIGARKYLPGRLGRKSHYLDAIQTILPDELFADSTRLSDFSVRFDQKWYEMLRQGELAGAALQFIKYGNIDVRAKQRVAYAMLRATAVTKGRGRGLRGRALKDYVREYMKNPPQQDRLQAVNAAQFEMLNYADSPDFINKLVTNDYGTLITPFPRFGAAYAAKQKDRLSALKLFMGKVPKGQRADAFADILSVGMFGAGGAGAAVSALGMLLDDDEDDDPRKFIGTGNMIVDEGEGFERKRFDSEFITANRINLSYWARLAGIDNEDDTDFWLRVRQYPAVGMAGALVMGVNDTARYGPEIGLETYGRMFSELGGEFLSFGAGVRVGFKMLADWNSDRPQPSLVDPFAASVPLSFYITDELMGAFIPGQRQADRMIAWVDPIYRRPTRSKELGYDPGVLEAFRASHWTGLLDRVAVQKGLANPLPPKGKVETVSKIPSLRMTPDIGKRMELFEESLRSQTARDYTRLTKRNNLLFGEHMTKQEMTAFIPEANIRRMPWETKISSLGGFNIRPYPRSEIEEALKRKQLPIRPTLPR